MSILRPQDVTGHRLVIVDLGSGLCDQFHEGGIARDVRARSAMTVKVVTTLNLALCRIRRTMQP